jgi:coiled-coil and C2 domain-containing protein 1
LYKNENFKFSLLVASSQSLGTAESLESALKERLEVYRRSKTVAENEENSSKARRYGRICKQFEDALKLHSKGKPVPLGELPTPPGFPPLSNIVGSAEGAAKPTPSLPEVPEAKASEPLQPLKPSPEKASKPVAPPRTNTGARKHIKNFIII